MSTYTQFVFNGNNNNFAFLFKEAGVPINFKTVTRIVLKLNEEIIDSELNKNAIFWGERMGKAVGEIEFRLGMLNLPNGDYNNVSLTVYDSGHLQGQVLIHKSLNKASVDVKVIAV